jgi:NADPH2:quinone reductase
MGSLAAVSGNRIRAARLHQHGEPLREEEIDLPEPGEGEVRVRLSYGGVNPVDRYIAEGRVAPTAPRPRTLGGEASGELDGRAVLVAGEALGSARDGVWAQAANVPRAAILELPEGVSHREAAAMGVAGLTAWNTVVDLGHVSAGDRVVVLGASGGVGSVIVSLAKSLGATVWGHTGSEAKAAGIERQGADRVVVGGPDTLAGALEDFEPTVVFDPLGDDFVRPAVEALAPEGRLVTFGTSAGAEVALNLQSLYRKSGQILGYGGMQVSREARRAGLQLALEALADGRMRVPVDDVLELGAVNEAFARLTDRRVQGKLLLDLS